MTAPEFLRRIQADWGRQLPEEQCDELLLNLQKYSDAERETIFQACKQLPPHTFFSPRLVDSVAQEVGIWPERKRREEGDGPKGYAFQTTSNPDDPDCEKCEDMGLRWMVVRPEIVELPEGGHTVRRQFVTYLPPSKARTPQTPDHYLLMSRCDCAAGGRQPEKTWRKPANRGR